MGSKDNAKGLVIKQTRKSKPSEKAIVVISDKEENLTTKDVGYLLIKIKISAF
jgi:hypothetical protein